MDEALEELRRSRKLAPGDFQAALKLALACERAGLFDEAWEAVEAFAHDADETTRQEAREVLSDLAEESPRALLERLRRVDYRSARLLCELLAEIGQARNPALVALAAARGDRVLRGSAAQVLRGSLRGELGDVARWLPDELGEAVDKPGPSRGLALRMVDRAGLASTVALLPWLLPLLTARDAQLAARALDVVRRLTNRDAPPFDVDELARAMREAE